MEGREGEEMRVHVRGEGKREGEERTTAVDDSARQRRKSRAPRKINTGYVSGGVYTRAPRTEGNSYGSGFQPLFLSQRNLLLSEI